MKKRHYRAVMRNSVNTSLPKVHTPMVPFKTRGSRELALTTVSVEKNWTLDVQKESR